MRTLIFAKRNTKEILRDPLTFAFGIGFPIVILLLLSAIQSNIPVKVFEINSLTPGIAVFGLSFISLFSGMLIAKDRSSSFLMRLFASPMGSFDFILGYTLPLIPMAIIQTILCFIVALFFKLDFTVNIFLTLLVLVPSMILFIAIGLLCGSLLNDKQVGGICGALLTNLCAFLSGTWFDLNLVGGWFKSLAEALPFVHGVNACRAALNGDYSNIMGDLTWVIVYALIILVLAIIVFRRQMISNK